MWRMKRSILQTAIVLVLIVLIAGVSTLSAATQNPVSSKYSSFTSIINQKSIDMLIFVSPQYAADAEIKAAINSYCKAVKDDLGWNTKVILVTQADNDFKKIDNDIERYHGLYDIKACIMVGEDLDTALAGDCDYMEKPSIVPWFTVGGEDAYKLSDQGVVCQPYVMDICISLIYPTHDFSYQTKKAQIISAFDKFCTQRGEYFIDDISIFESSAVNTRSEGIYKQMNKYGTLLYHEDPTDLELSDSLDDSYSMFYVHGHSNPSGTDLNIAEGGWFSAALIDELKTPFFGADGCYVGGWWSGQVDNNKLDASIDNLWYGSTIFTSRYVQVMVLGLLSQNGFSYPVSFIENALPGLAEGKTLAESMISHTYLGETIIVGDPTFHYTC
jgi:hypothetical protein